MDSRADFHKENIVKIHDTRIKEIKEYALGLGTDERYRLCLHESPENVLQEMLICRVKDDYFWPERHEMPETHIIIDGKELMVFFDKDGNIEDACVLEVDGIRMCRTNHGLYHMTIVLTDIAIDYEVSPGPFCREAHIHPEWAPNGDDKNEAKEFVERIKKSAFSLLRGQE